MALKSMMIAQAIKRLKGKSLKDFFIYFRRKVFLQYVKFVDRYYPSKYFFSHSYLRKFLDQSYHSGRKIIDASNGIFVDIETLVDRLLDWKIEYPKECKQHLNHADKFLQHEFDLLGSGPVNLSFPCSPTGIEGIKYNIQASHLPTRNDLLSPYYKCIDWHIDFRSGYRWDPLEYYPHSRSYSRTKGADIKLPWELSRCQWLPVLSIAYVLTKEEKFAVEVYDVIIDWISNNLLCKGPNWNCPMDVGIRISNWFVALEILGGYFPPNYADRRAMILSSAIQHLDYLKNNFEWTSKVTTNHYLANIAGFAFCVHYIPYLKSRARFTEFARAELISELSKQMYKDGMNSEGSTNYHRLVLELFSYSAFLTKDSLLMKNVQFSEHLKTCFEFTSELIRPDNSFPQIGDNDSGIFLGFSSKTLDDMNYLMAVGARLFPDCGFQKVITPGSLESALFDLKIPVRESAQNSKILCVYEHSGVAIVNSGDRFLTFYFGKNGQNGNGGHCHNDKLSFTLWSEGQELFADSGTGFYTSVPEVRNFLRSTSCHNTVSIENQEQNRIDGNNLFSVREDVNNVEFTVESGTDFIEFRGSHDGFKRIGKNIIHSRTLKVSLDGLNLEINDDIGFCEGKAFFIVLKSSQKVITGDVFESDRVKISFDGASSVRAEDQMTSNAYGTLNAGNYQKLVVDFASHLKTKIEVKAP